MPSRYDVLVAAAKDGRSRFGRSQELAFRTFAELVQGLLSFGDVPAEKITFLKWNGEHGESSGFTEAEDSRRWTLPGAVSYDEEEGYWNLGIAVTLTPAGHLPANWFAFALALTDEDGVMYAKKGKGARMPINTLEDRAQLFEQIFADAENMLREVQKKPSAVRRFGFL